MALLLTSPQSKAGVRAFCGAEAHLRKEQFSLLAEVLLRRRETRREEVSLTQRLKRLQRLPLRGPAWAEFKGSSVCSQRVEMWKTPTEGSGNAEAPSRKTGGLGLISGKCPNSL